MNYLKKIRVICPVKLPIIANMPIHCHLKTGVCYKCRVVFVVGVYSPRVVDITGSQREHSFTLGMLQW